MSRSAAERPAKSVAEVARIYDERAACFDRFDAVERLLTGRYRKRLFSRARGEVLDAACGTGANFPYLPDGVALTGVDISDEMLAAAARRAEALGLAADLVEMDAAALAFPDDSFDTVVSSLSTCTFPDPEGTLREMARVCRPDGRILLFEHGRSSVGLVARVQDRWAPRHFERMGCRMNQEPAALVAGAGLDVLAVRRHLLGVFTSMIVAPADA